MGPGATVGATDAAFVGNTAAQGGAADVFFGRLNVTLSNFTNNTDTARGFACLDDCSLRAQGGVFSALFSAVDVSFFKLFWQSYPGTLYSCEVLCSPLTNALLSSWEATSLIGQFRLHRRLRRRRRHRRRRHRRHRRRYRRRRRRCPPWPALPTTASRAVLSTRSVERPPPARGTRRRPTCRPRCRLCTSTRPSRSPA